MKVIIFKPSKNAMQSGRAKSASWVLEYETETARYPDALMGWQSSGDTLNQVRMHFDDEKSAVRFAKEKGWDYTVLPPHQKKVKPRNFGDNFKYIPPEDSE